VDHVDDDQRANAVHRAKAVILARHPHLQGLALGAAMLGAAAAGMPAVLHALQDLAKMPPPPAKVATLDPSPEPQQGSSQILVLPSR
jgi:hypothetical protein